MNVNVRACDDLDELSVEKSLFMNGQFASLRVEGGSVREPNGDMCSRSRMLMMNESHKYRSNAFICGFKYKERAT